MQSAPARLRLPTAEVIYQSGDGTVAITGSTLKKQLLRYEGGGIYVYIGSLTITGSTLTSNKASYGGGVLNYDGDVAISGCNLTSNSARTTDSNLGSGGAIYQSSGTVAITRSTLANNKAFGYGGGIYVETGTLTITASTLSGNSAASDGGGIYDYGMTYDGPTLTNDTISGNTAGGNGGGIYVNAGALTTVNVTIAYNTAGIAGGGLFAAGGTAVEIYNTIVASNTAGTFGDIAGTVSGWYNLIGTGGTGGLFNGIHGNQVGVADPGLGTLGYYGGPTETIPIFSSGPAVGMGSSDIPGITTPTVDQRGYPRPSDFIDIGVPAPVDADGNHRKRNRGRRRGPDARHVAQYGGDAARDVYRFQSVCHRGRLHRGGQLGRRVGARNPQRQQPLHRRRHRWPSRHRVGD